MRYMINVTASTPYRYASLTMMALPENAIAPSVASSRPCRLAAREEWEWARAFTRPYSTERPHRFAFIVGRLQFGSAKPRIVDEFAVGQAAEKGNQIGAFGLR